MWDNETAYCVPVREYTTESPTASTAPSSSEAPTLAPTRTNQPSMTNATEKKLCLIVYANSDDVSVALTEPNEFASMATLLAKEGNENIVSWYYRDKLGTGADGKSTYNLFEKPNYVAKKTLEGEQDSDKKETLKAFLLHALKDCKAKMALETMVLFNTHAGPSIFGGDKNPKDLSTFITHDDNVATLKEALAEVEKNEAEGSKRTKYDVIGFNSCGVLDKEKTVQGKYGGISKHMLATPAPKCSVGWHLWENLAAKKWCALDLAKAMKAEFNIAREITLTDDRKYDNEGAMLELVDLSK